MIQRLLSNEPALVVGLVQTGIALAVSFGLDLTPEQVGAITAFTAALLALVLRQAVVAPATLVDVAAKAATETARDLGSTSAGAVGTVTDRGAAVVVDAVDRVVSEVGGLVPALAQRED